MLFAHSAAAHDRTTSYSSWDIHGRSAQVTVRLSELDVSRFPWAATAGADLDRLLSDYLTQHVQLLANTTPCAVVEAPGRLLSPPGRVAFEWRVACPDSGSLQLRSTLLLDVAPSHLHFARVTRNGAHAQERVLSEAEHLWLLPDAAPQQTVEPNETSMAGYIGLGIRQILGGYDHLTFLLALLLIGGSLADAVKVVTGFTVAHSITLGLSVLGYLHLDHVPVEALIGLSIVLVAAENGWLVGRRSRVLPWVIAAALALLAVAAGRGHGRVPALTLGGLGVFTLCYFGLLRRLSRTASVRWVVAFIFGLVYGCAFAAVLGEAGLPADRAVPALLGFNVGIELGLLIAVALLWPLLQWVAHRRAPVRLAVIEVGSAAALALGMFWFVTRTFG